MTNVTPTVAALYVDLRGPYPSIPGVQCWGLPERDALEYDGPHPVVAHPPCGPWGKLAFVSVKQDPTCGPRAVAQVRRWGGVLEHPQGSRLFRRCGMPHPVELPDEWGGRTIEVEQVKWGHVARKRTWLYLVGVAKVPPDPPPREPTHWCSGFRTGGGRSYPAGYQRTGCAVPEGIKVCSAQQRRRTPPAFAELLVSLARQAGAAQRNSEENSDEH